MIGHAKRAAGVELLLPDAREIDLHYVPSRYPNGLPSGYPHSFYGRNTAERAVGAAGRILDTVAEDYRTLGEHDIVAPQE